jgi:hypothetical protein
MKNFEIIARMKKMDNLITQRATGTPNEFAEKIGLSVSRLYGILVEIKELGVPVTYSRIQKTYMSLNPQLKN